MNTAEWLETWFDLYVVPSKLAPSTVAMYRRSINAVPLWLANTPLAELDSLALQRWLVSVAKATPRAAQLDRVMLNRALKVAGKLGYCRPGLIDEDLTPRIQHTTKKAIVFTPEEAHRYLETIKGSRSYPLLLLCLVCGLRRGEALGLKWTDIDQSTGTISISRQRQRQKGRYQTRPLKTSSSVRVLQLPPDALQAILHQPRTLGGWVVDVTPEQMHRDHRAAIEAAHLPPVTIHGLRHTMATIAAASGISLKLLQTAMGHSTVKLTADLYANHPFPPNTTPSLVWQGIA